MSIRTHHPPCSCDTTVALRSQVVIHCYPDQLTARAALTDDGTVASKLAGRPAATSFYALHCLCGCDHWHIYTRTQLTDAWVADDRLASRLALFQEEVRKEGRAYWLPNGGRA